MNLLRSLFVSRTKVDLFQLLEQGAVIVDVRTKAEFAQGHVLGSINIPLDTLSQRMRELPKE